MRISKHSLDSALEIADFGTALEFEERGQITMIRQGAAARAATQRVER
jgi:hypothetical protein